MNKDEWKAIKEVRLHIIEDGSTWSFPIHCPRWFFWVLEKLQK